MICWHAPAAVAAATAAVLCVLHGDRGSGCFIYTGSKPGTLDWLPTQVCKPAMPPATAHLVLNLVRTNLIIAMLLEELPRLVVATNSHQLHRMGRLAPLNFLISGDRAQTTQLLCDAG